MKKKFSNIKPTGGKTDVSGGAKIAMGVAFGIGVGLLSLCLLLMIFSALCLMSDNPHAMIAPLSFAAIYTSAFIAGMCCAKRNGSSSVLICGLLEGVCFCALLWFIFFAVGLSGSEDENLKNAFIWRLLTIPSSVLGAICTLKRPSPKRRKKY